jgi:hypothetical protein
MFKGIKEQKHIDEKPDLTPTDGCSDSENIEHPHEKLVACPCNEDSHSAAQPVQPIVPKSPKRQSRKEKKQRFRALLGIVDATTATVIKATKRTEIPEEREVKLSLHYFWFSRFWIRIYATLLLSILSREPAILHGVTIIICYCMLKRAFIWGMFLSTTNEAASSLQHFRWMYKFALTTLEKALDGDRLRGFLATKTIQFWTGSGMNFILSFLREQSRDIRKRTLKETRDSLERQIRQTLDKTHS